MSRRGSAKVAVAGEPSVSADPPISHLPIHELGEGRLEPGLPNGRPQRVLRIDVTGAPPNLLGRLLVGSYITGQDQVLITGRDGLSADQRAEVRRAADRLLGMTVVGDTAGSVEVQNFVDPGKHELPHLLHRVVQMLRAELSACGAALDGGEVRRLSVVRDIEQEVDRFYILMVRQLLLSSDDPRIAHNIDVESHHYQIGDRMVAKVLEVVGDLIYGISTDLQAALPALRRQAPAVVRELESRVHRLDQLLFRSMAAFVQLSIVEANGILNDLAERIPTDSAYGQEIARRVHDRHAAVACQRIACSLDMALEMLVIVNEVTINRGVEPVFELPVGSRSKPGDHPIHSRLPSSQTEISILAQKGRKKSRRD
jgi:phosphate uptake regulator